MTRTSSCGTPAIGEIGSVIITRGMTYSVPMIIIGAMIIVWAKRRAPVSPKRIADKADD